MSAQNTSALTGNAPEVSQLGSTVEMAIEMSVSKAMKAMEEKLSKAEANWKEEASLVLQHVSKNRRYVEDFMAKQGDYVHKLNSFSDEFRREIDSKIHKGLSGGNGVVAEVLGNEDLPPDYFWRLERLEKQVGTHRYLERNKEARSVNARLTSLENAAGIDPNAEAYIDSSGWNDFRSGPVSSLRVFSRESGSLLTGGGVTNIGKPLRSQTATDNTLYVSSIIYFQFLTR